MMTALTESLTSSGLVSVIIPTYNRAPLVARAVRSALSQDYPHKQVIVVDDGSTDETREQLVCMNGVEYLAQTNQGPAAARQTGLAAARGELVATLDSDDYWHTDYLSRNVKALEETGAGFTFSNWRVAGPASPPNHETKDQLHRVARYQPLVAPSGTGWSLIRPAQLRELMVAHAPCPCSGTVMRRTLMGHGWERGIHIGEDWLFFLGVVLKHAPSAAFTLDQLWTKWMDGSNIYDGQFDYERVARGEIQHNVQALELFAKQMTRAEVRQTRGRIARACLDWAYHESIHGSRLKAAQLCGTAFRWSPSPRALEHLLKAALRPKRRLVNRPGTG